MLRERVVHLERLAYLDSLTKLIYSKEGFEREFGKQMYDYKKWSYLFIDVDNFKQVNSRLGRRGADKILKRIIVLIHKRLRERKPFIMYRPYGGDEMGVMLLGLEEDDAVAVAEEIRNAVAEDEPLKHYGATISVGVADAGFFAGRRNRQSVKRNFTALRLRANLALSDAKERGKNLVSRWSHIEPFLSGVSGKK